LFQRNCTTFIYAIFTLTISLIYHSVLVCAPLQTMGIQ
jgi:hypothetical protein